MAPLLCWCAPFLLLAAPRNFFSFNPQLLCQDPDIGSNLRGTTAPFTTKLLGNDHAPR